MTISREGALLGSAVHVTAEYNLALSRIIPPRMEDASCLDHTQMQRRLEERAKTDAAANQVIMNAPP